MPTTSVAEHANRGAPDTLSVEVDDWDGEEGFDVIEEPADASGLSVQPSDSDLLKSRPTTLTVDYHIVYSSSYQVPVLYFNAFYPDGTALPLADLYTCLVPPTHLSSLSSATAASRQGSISQQDHPVLGAPYFYVHPCETAALMSAVRPGEGGSVGEEGYLRAWLSLVGGVVGVRVKVGYFVEVVE